MEWTTLCCLLISSALIMSSDSDGLRHKRNLSLLAKLVSNEVGRSQGKCSKSQGKSSREYDIFVFPGRQNIAPVTVQQISRTPASKSTKSNEDHYFLTSLRRFLASDTLRETKEAVRGAITTLMSGDSSTEENNKSDIVQKPQYDNQIVSVDHKPEIALISEYPVPIDNNEYSQRKIVAMSPVVNFMSPIISMPRKYSYEQIRGKGVQTFYLDSNSDIRVTETSNRLPRPTFVEDRIKDVILSVQRFPQQTHFGIPNVGNDKDSIKANIFQGEIISNNEKSMYTGAPIIVLEDHSKVINTTVSIQDNENNKTTERNIKEKPRGDIPESPFI